MVYQFFVLFDAVGVEELAVFIAVDNIHAVIVGLAQLVLFLDAAARRGVVAGYRKAYGRAVAEGNLLLYQPLAEGTASYNQTSVVVLYGPGKDFARRGRPFVGEDDKRCILEGAGPVRDGILTLEGPAFGIDNQPVGREQFVGHVDGNIHQTTAVAAQVDDKAPGSLVVQLGEGIDELVVGGASEFAYLDVASLVVEHEGDVDAVHGNVAPGYLVGEGLLGRLAHDGEFDYRVFGTFQIFYYALVADAFAHEGRVVDGDDAVAGQNAHLFGGTARDYTHYVDGVVEDIELNADAAERAFQLFIDTLQVLGRNIGRVGVELAQNLGHDVFDKVVSVYGIDILLFDTLQQAFDFVVLRAAAEGILNGEESSD